MVNEYEIVVFLRQVWWYAGKREGFGRRMENEIERKMRRKEYRQSKTDLRCLYLYLGYSQPIIYLFIFIIL